MAYTDSGWDYSDWEEQSTYSARKARLVKHIRELSDYVTSRSAGGGQSFDPTPIQMQITELRKILFKYFGGYDVDSTDPRAEAGFVRGIPQS